MIQIDDGLDHWIASPAYPRITHSTILIGAITGVTSVDNASVWPQGTTPRRRRTGGLLVSPAVGSARLLRTLITWNGSSSPSMERLLAAEVVEAYPGDVGIIGAEAFGCVEGEPGAAGVEPACEQFSGAGQLSMFRRPSVSPHLASPRESSARGRPCSAGPRTARRPVLARRQFWEPGTGSRLLCAARPCRGRGGAGSRGCWCPRRRGRPR